MNLAHLHLLLNHVPVIGIPLGLLLLAWGMVRRSDDLLRGGLLLLVITGFAAIPAYFTGEPAEDVVEHLPGVAASLVEAHEEAATAAAVAAAVLGVLAAVALYVGRGRRAMGRPTSIAALCLAIVATALVGWAAHLGGQIHHPEARGGAATAQTAEPETDD